MLNTEYFDSSEQRCWELFEKFNEVKLRLEEVERTPQYSDVDASGKTLLGDKVIIELKSRNLNLLSGDGFTLSGESRNGIFTSTTVMVEEHKLVEMCCLNLTEHAIPLYVNFLNNCVIVYNLLKLKSLTSERTRVLSRGYNGFEIAKRWFMNLEDAFIYTNNDYQLLRKP